MTDLPVDGRQSETALQIARGVRRLLRARGYASVTELPLLDGRRADVVALHDALRAGTIDAMFADGLTLAIWLSGEDSADCCAFRGGPFLESRYFGQGIGIAVRKEDADLRRAMDWALARIAARGDYGEIYRKYFPIGFY